METTKILSIDPKDIGRTIFPRGWYEGEIKDLTINVRSEGDEYGEVGEMTLHAIVALELPDGISKLFDERYPMQGRGAFNSAKFLKGIGAQRGADLSVYDGAKVRMEFDTPREYEGRQFNNFVRIQLA